MLQGLKHRGHFLADLGGFAPMNEPSYSAHLSELL
jgi:hypothetical protein